MTSVGQPGAPPPSDDLEPFQHAGLGALLAAAVQDCPDLVMIRDDKGASSAADLARRVRRLAHHFRQLGLLPGERVLILAGAQADAVVVLIAALRAGLAPALAGCGLGPIELAAHARVSDAVALVGPSSYGSLDLGDTYLSAVALVDTVRIVATHGPDLVDGASDIGFAALDAMPDPPDDPDTAIADWSRDAQPSRDAPVPDSALIATFEGPPTTPVLVTHRQAALLADALSLVEQARINPSKRIVSTLPLVTLAGLVGGPFAAFIGASSLVLHGPFEAKAFLAACDAEPGFHLVGPRALGVAFEEPKLAAGVASLILVSRFPGAHDFVLPPPIACDRPIVDLYAFGEDTLLAQRREGGEARPPSRVTDKSATGGLGARLNRARADGGPYGSATEGR